MGNIKLEELYRHLENEYDVFIVSASYENRCLSIPEHLLSNIKFKHKIASISIPHKELIEPNKKKIQSLGFNFIEIDNNKQLYSAEAIMKPIGDILHEKPDASFLIDITTFTRQTLLILLRLLRNVLTKKNKLHLVYSPAKEYSIGLPFNEKWLTLGVLGVSSVYGFAGLMRPSSSYHLIILMGYEVERAMSLIDYYEPAKISIGYARQKDSMSDELYNLNIQRFEQLREEYPSADNFEFSCSDVKECTKEIISVVRSHKNYNTVIAPMNNKISTVACAYAGFEDKYLQIATAIPAIYNSANYSTPSDSCFIVDSHNLIHVF